MYLGLKGLRTVFLSLGKESPYIFFTFNLLNTDTPLIWTLSMASSVSILTSFDGKCEEGHRSKHRHNLREKIKVNFFFFNSPMEIGHI